MGGGSGYIDHADAIGSTVMETDPAGAVQWDVVNGPWGQVWQQTGTRQSAVFADLDWQVNDPLMPSATREYSDGLGRWLTPDPDNAGSDLGDSQSWNMYSYAGDNPVSLNDPSGEDYYLLGGESCGADKVECDKQGYVLGANGQREIITDQQVLSGAVGTTVGENGVSTITTSQGTFKAQFFDNSPATYEVSGQPGSVLASIGANIGIGVWNQAADIANTFMTQLTVGQYSMSLPYVPGGSGVAANTGAIAPLLAGIVVPGGEEEVVPSAGQLAQAENTLLRDGPGAVEKAIRTLERRIAEHEEKISTAGGYTSSMERELGNFRQLLRAYRQVLGR